MKNGHRSIGALYLVSYSRPGGVQKPQDNVGEAKTEDAAADVAAYYPANQRYYYTKADDNPAGCHGIPPQHMVYLVFPAGPDAMRGGYRLLGVMFKLGVHIDIEPVRALISQPESFSQMAGNPGFRLYWQSQGRDPAEVAQTLAKTESGRAAALNEEQPDGRSVLNSLGRISGASIEQQVARHLPSEVPDFRVSFVPGGAAPLAAEGNTVAVNAFALELRAIKLFLGDFPLLSLLANRIHRLGTQSLYPSAPGTTCSRILSNFLGTLLREGSATLFFTMPVSGPVHQLWEKAEARREAQVELLRQYLQVKDGDMAPPTLARELEQAFALSGNADLAAKYPLGTWICQVIEGAFGRSHLLTLYRQPQDFLPSFERARSKFGLAEKYSLGVSQ
jgi:hypothetical protein